MKELPYTLEQAQRLFNKGFISDQQFEKIKGSLAASSKPVKGMASGGDVADDQAYDKPQVTSYDTTTTNSTEGAPVVESTQAPLSMAPPLPVGPGVYAPPSDVMPVSANQAQMPTPSLLTNPQPGGVPGNLKLASDIQITRPVEGAAPSNPYNLPTGVGTVQGINTAYDKMIKDSLQGSGAGALGQAQYNAYTEGQKAQDLINAKMNDDKQQQLKQQQQLIDTLHGEANNISNMKIDQNRFWNNMSTEGKVTASIGLLLGSFGAGPNRAAEVMDNAVKRDIDAQKADMENAKAGYTAKKGIYGDMLGLFKDKDMAYLATLAQAQQKMQNQVQANAAKFAGSGEGAKLKMLSDQIELQRQETMLKFNQQAGQVAAMQQLAGGNTNVNPLLLDEKTRQLVVPGYGLASSPKDAEEMKTAIAESNSAKESIATLKKYAEMGSKLNPIDAARAAAAKESLIGAGRIVLYGGRPLESELEALQKLVPNPTDFSAVPAATKAKLDGLQNEFDSKLKAKANAIGMKTQEQKLGLKPLEKATATKP